MDQNRTAVERAFDLAHSGKCRSLTEVRIKLHAEGYDVGQIYGPQLIAQLNAIFQERPKRNK